MNEFYVIKLFSTENNKYSYLYENNPYRDVFEANKFSSYKEGMNRMQNFLKFNSKTFDVNKSKVCKITLIKEEM